mgnify:CR=1 FL=1
MGNYFSRQLETEGSATARHARTKSSQTPSLTLANAFPVLCHRAVERPPGNYIDAFPRCSVAPVQAARYHAPPQSGQSQFVPVLSDAQFVPSSTELL